MQLSSLPGLASTFLRVEGQNLRRYDLPVTDRLRLYRHGFASERGILYDLASNPHSDYLSDVEYLRTQSINQPNQAGLANKLLFDELVSQSHPELLPDLLGVTRNGSLVDGPFELCSVDALYDYCCDSRAVVKPIQASGGAEVHVVVPGKRGPRIDGQTVTESGLAAFLDDRPASVVTAYVEQAAYADDIYPDSANTVRLVTMVDPETGEPFIATGVHRFGGGDSGHVDNWSSGGLVVALDTETGELGEAAVPPKDGTLRTVAEHPDTGARISGITVPGWDDIVEGVLDLAGEYGWLWPYVGWDVVVTGDDGSFQILEGNYFPHVPMMQIHEPLLANPRIRRFYEYHGVV